MATEFTPFASLFGGVLIGLSAILLMLVMGRIMGATGILAGLIRPVSTSEFKWRLALFAGMISAPALVFLVSGQLPAVQVNGIERLLIGGDLDIPKTALTD